MIQLTEVALLLALILGPPLQTSSPTPPCMDGDGGRAGYALDCVNPTQVDAVLWYSNPENDPTVLREALVDAAEIASCINRSDRFPTSYLERQDYLCLQQQLLEFYDAVASQAPVASALAGQAQPDNLDYLDRLSRAETAFHHCIFPYPQENRSEPPDPALPNSRGCNERIAQAVIDYRTIFGAARQIQEEPGHYSSGQQAIRLDLDPDSPAPDFPALENFIDGAVEAADRFPETFGARLGPPLSDTLCDAYELYDPAQRHLVTEAHQLLIAFDGGDLRGSSQVYKFLEEFSKLFPVAPRAWDSSQSPCGSESEFRMPSLMALEPPVWPSPAEVSEQINDLHQRLVHAANRSKIPFHIWQPFHRFSEFLFLTAARMRDMARGDSQQGQIRSILMAEARDALMLKGVDRSKLTQRPDQVNEILSLASRQILEYGDELLSDLRFKELVAFADPYLQLGEGLLASRLLQRLHRQLAIAYYLDSQDGKALVHLRQSDLSGLSELREIREALRSKGIGLFKK